MDETATQSAETKWGLGVSTETLYPKDYTQTREVEKVDVQELIDSFPWTLYGQRVVAFEVEIEKVSGLFIPETSRREGEMRTNEGYVIAIGSDVSFCKPNDIILYGRFSGAWQEVNGRRYRLMNEEDILAVKRGTYNA